MSVDESAEHFQVFASNLEKCIEKYGPGEDESLLERQRRQIKLLISLETKFRKVLLEHRWGPGIYRRFVHFICEERRNILAARPYFRERQTVFTKYISNALKKKRDRSLYRFRFNYMFVLFALRCYRWRAGSEVVALAKQIESIRRELMEMNMPLAISQTRIFWSSTPRSHLSYMDLIQIHCAGLLAAIDKFVPGSTRGMTKTQALEEYRKFRAVAIGRMIGDRIEQYSETLIHFYPVDKRKIYRANKRLRRFPDQIDHEALSQLVNAEVDNPAHRTNAAEIADLLASASVLSLDAETESEPDGIISRYVDPATEGGEKIEKADAMIAMQAAIQDLPMMEKKLLRMRGVSYE